MFVSRLFSVPEFLKGSSILFVVYFQRDPIIYNQVIVWISYLFQNIFWPLIPEQFKSQPMKITSGFLMRYGTLQYNFIETQNWKPNCLWTLEDGRQIHVPLYDHNFFVVFINLALLFVQSLCSIK